MPKWKAASWSKASEAQVKAFAEHLGGRPYKANMELKSLASAKGYEPPAEPTKKQKAQLKCLGHWKASASTLLLQLF